MCGCGAHRTGGAAPYAGGVTSQPPATRRLAITLRKWPLGFYPGVRPTIVVEGRGQPTQWGEGTWQVPAGRETTVSVFMFQHGMTFGRAEHRLKPGDEPSLEYRAPAIFFFPGSLGPRGATAHRGRWVLLPVLGLLAAGVIAALVL